MKVNTNWRHKCASLYAGVCGCAEKRFSVCVCVCVHVCMNVCVCVCVRVTTIDWHKRCPLLDWDVISSDLA